MRLGVIYIWFLSVDRVVNRHKWGVLGLEGGEVRTPPGHWGVSPPKRSPRYGRNSHLQIFPWRSRLLPHTCYHVHKLHYAQVNFRKLDPRAVRSYKGLENGGVCGLPGPASTAAIFPDLLPGSPPSPCIRVDIFVRWVPGYPQFPGVLGPWVQGLVECLREPWGAWRPAVFSWLSWSFDNWHPGEASCPCGDPGVPRDQNPGPAPGTGHRNHCRQGWIAGKVGKWPS